MTVNELIEENFGHSSTRIGVSMPYDAMDSAYNRFSVQ